MKNDGTVWSCGFNGSGELGIGNSGNYKSTVVQTTGLCAVTTSIEEIAANKSLEIYPNPGNGLFTVKVEQNGARIEIINMLGQIIYTSNVPNVLSKSLSTGTFPIDLSSCSKGIYLCRLLDENKLLGIGKIILQ